MKQYTALFLLALLPLSLSSFANADPGYEYADSNQDGIINILDIVTTVQIVLGNQEADSDVAFGNADINCDG